MKTEDLKKRMIEREDLRINLGVHIEAMKNAKVCETIEEMLE